MKTTFGILTAAIIRCTIMVLLLFSVSNALAQSQKFVPVNEALKQEPTSFPNTVNVNSLQAGFVCGGGFTGAHSKGAEILANGQNDCYYYGIYWPDSVCLYEKALTYYGIDPVKCRDSMRKYVELHPFATVYPGETVSGLGTANTSTYDIWYSLSGSSNEPFINQYNWLVRMQPVNLEEKYQKSIIQLLASMLDNLDWNEEANMLWNYTQLFPEDTGIAHSIWHSIEGLRQTQSRVPQDTTPFHRLTFPLQPLQDNGVNQNVTAPRVNVTISNPNVAEITINYELAYDGEADFIIFNQLGNEMLHKRAEYLQRGNQKIVLPLNGLPSGAYYLRMMAGSSVITKPFLVIR